MPSGSFARYGAIVLASFTMLMAPVERALAQRPSNPVTVGNPATSPALTSSVDDPGRIAYQSAVTIPGCASNAGPCAAKFSAVPQNHRLVIQHVSGSIAVSSNPGSILVVLSQFVAGITPSSTFIVTNRADDMLRPVAQKHPVASWGSPRQPPRRGLTLAADRRQPFVNRAAIRSWQRPAPCAVRRLTGWNTHTVGQRRGRLLPERYPAGSGRPRWTQIIITRHLIAVPSAFTPTHIEPR
jgi:hypothetical protein